MYQYYIERVIKGGTLSGGRPGCIVRPGYGVSGRDSIAATNGVLTGYSLLSLILFPLYCLVSIEVIRISFVTGLMRAAYLTN